MLVAEIEAKRKSNNRINTSIRNINNLKLIRGHAINALTILSFTTVKTVGVVLVLGLGPAKK